MSYRTGPKIVTDGLVLCLDAGDRNSYAGSGSTWYDLSGNGNNGTFGASTAAPTFSSSNGGCIVFDGSNDYIDCGSSVEQLSTGITVAAWYKAATIGKVWDMIVTRGSGGFNLRYNNNTRFPHFCININGIFIDQGEYSTSIQVPDEQWTYLVGVYDGSQVITYVNGISAGSYSISGSISSNTNSVLIGKKVDSNSYNFDGSIASVKMYNRGLYQNEIQQNYHATKGRFGL